MRGYHPISLLALVAVVLLVGCNGSSPTRPAEVPLESNLESVSAEAKSGGSTWMPLVGVSGWEGGTVTVSRHDTKGRVTLKVCGPANAGFKVVVYKWYKVVASSLEMTLNKKGKYHAVEVFDALDRGACLRVEIWSTAGNPELVAQTNDFFMP